MNGFYSVQRLLLTLFALHVDVMKVALSRRRFRLITILTIVAVFGIPLLGWTMANGQDADELARQGLNKRNYPWYDRSSDGLRPLEFHERPAANSADRGLIPPAPQVSAPRTGTFGGGGNWFWSLLNGMAWVALVLLILAIVAFLSWAFFRLESKPVGLETGKTRTRAESIEQLSFDLENPTGDFRQLAQQAYARSDFRRAAIYLFSHVLVTLDQANLIRLRKGKTNRQYLSELRAQRPLAEFYQQVMEPFESVFFGDHELSQQQFESCWLQLENFHNRVEQASPIAR